MKTCLVIVLVCVCCYAVGITAYHARQASHWTATLSAWQATVEQRQADLTRIQQTGSTCPDVSVEAASIERQLVVCEQRTQGHRDQLASERTRAIGPVTPSVTAPPVASAAVRADAIMMAKEFVRKRLTYSDSAKFPFFQVDVIDLGGNTFGVSGKVDAKNGVGATLRYTYTVILSVSGDTWTLHTIEMTP